MKLAGGVLALLAAAVFFVRGGINQALVLGLLGAWLLGWRGRAWGGFPAAFPARAASRRATARASRRITSRWSSITTPAP